MFQIDDEDSLNLRACIKVVGIGGGGGNAIKTMREAQLSGVEFIVANTDSQALEEHEGLCKKIQLGEQLTKGLGAGANPEVGRQAAIESCDDLAEHLKGADMVFITAGMGGGTGTGAAGVIASIAKRQGALTVGVVTRPFFFEGRRRSQHAEMGIQFLKENVDTLIVIPNQKLLSTSDENTSLLSAFKNVDNILLKAVQGISDLINQKGLINLDFADVKTIMSEKGLAIIGTGSATGEERALLAAQRATSSPLLEDTSFKGASGVIINITGGPDLSLAEVNQIAEFIIESAHPDAEIIFGAIVSADPACTEVGVTVVATGFESQKNQEDREEISNNHSPQKKQDTQKNAKKEEQPSMVSTQNAQGTLAPAQEQKEGHLSEKKQPPSSLSKDILLEKARIYENQMNKKVALNSNLQNDYEYGQLSMDILDRHSESLSTHEIKEDVPFKQSKNPVSFMGLFKKADKNTLQD